MKSIETRYAGHLFRSRLEARWAAFFDMCGWNWTYEPFDWGGWIPDFQIGDMVVEVKPFSELKYFEMAIKKAWMCGRGMRHLPELLLLGIGPFHDGFQSNIGWLGEVHPESIESIDGDFNTPWYFDDAVLGMFGSSIGMCHGYGSYHDRISGKYDGSLPLPFGAQELRVMWGQAHEKTRWMPKGV